MQTLEQVSVKKGRKEEGGYEWSLGPRGQDQTVTLDGGPCTVSGCKGEGCCTLCFAVDS